MSDLKSLAKRFLDGVYRLSASWVNPGVTALLQRKQDAVLLGSVFALPLVAMASTALSPIALTGWNLGVPKLLLGSSLPLFAAAWLSLTGSKAARSVISVAILPSFYWLASPGSQFALEISMFAGLAATLLYRHRIIDGHHLAAGGLLVAASGLVDGAPLASVAAVLAMSVASVYGARAAEPATENAAPFLALDDLFDRVAEIAGESAIVLVTDRSGEILRSGNMTIAGSKAAPKHLFDLVHVSDRISLLTLLDGMTAGIERSEECQVRIAIDGKAGLCASYRTAKLRVIRMFDSIFVIARNAEADDPAEDDIMSPLALVSHEMRTPLNAIVGFSDMLEKGLAGDLVTGRQREYVELINRSGRHLLEVVNTMLTLSKARNGTYTLERTQFIADETGMLAVGMLSKQAQSRSIGLDYMPLCVVQPFFGDQRVLLQILVNLLSNAVKFTPDGGRVGLSIDLEDGHLTIEVTDTGIGMSEADISRIGTPFFQVQSGYRRSNEGTGLGLALVRQMANLHGGAMEIESEPGKGTRVRVTLKQLQDSEARLPSNVSVLRPPQVNESECLISLSEERLNEAPRKTA